MSLTLFYYIQVASTLSVLLPIIAGARKYYQLDFIFKAFLFFLFIGLLTDLAGWYFYLSQNASANMVARHTYDLFEALFLTALIRQLTLARWQRRLLTWMIPAVLGLWAARFYYPEAMSIFKASSQIVFSFLSGLIILQLVERHDRPSQLLSFWILLGIFFYCFCTYFIMALVLTKLSGIWPVHNFINIGTNLIYTVGFVRVPKKKHKHVLANR